MLRGPALPEHSGGGAERYLVTFADMLCLLLVLFIILYATANQDLEKFQALSQSLAEGFGADSPSIQSSQGGTPIADTSGGGAAPVELFPENQIPIQIFEFERSLRDAGGADGSLLREIKELVEAAEDSAGEAMFGLDADVKVDVSERGIRISIFPDQILFESGSAVLKPSFKAILDQLAAPIAQLPNQVEVQGHTDNIPISTGTYPSNWELSAGRAGAVIRYLTTKGVQSARLQAAGYADTRPLESNATAAGRSRNRRVEIIILRGAQSDSESAAAMQSLPDAVRPGESAAAPEAEDEFVPDIGVHADEHAVDEAEVGHSADDHAVEGHAADGHADGHAPESSGH